MDASLASPTDSFGIESPILNDDGVIEDLEKDIDETKPDEPTILTQFDDAVNEHDLVVLEPDHPLLKRFQAALKTLLEKQIEHVEIKFLESEEAVRKKKDEHMSLGNKVYNMQQELIRNQNDHEKTLEKLTLKRRQRVELEDTNKTQTFKLTGLKKDLDHDRKKVKKLKNDLDELSFKFSYLMGFRDEIKGDIKVLQNAASRSDSYKLEEEAKISQDFVMNMLVTNLDNTFENYKLYHAQLASQLADKEAVQQALKAAEKALEDVSRERTRLVSEWHTSVYGLQHRNELYCQMMNKLRERQEQLITYNVELDALKRLTGRSERDNEELTIRVNRTMNDINSIKKQCQQSNNKFELMKQEYASTARILSETEFVLKKTREDESALRQEINNIREDINRTELEKLEIEKEIEKCLKDKLRHMQTKSATLKAIRDLADKNRRIETIKTQFENELMKSRLEKATTKTQIDELNKKQLEFNRAINEKSTIMDQLDQQIARNVNAIQHKQDCVDRLCKELDRLLKANQGEEFGPYEATIKSLNKSIIFVQDKIDNLQQLWLRDQQKMVEDIYKQEAIRQDVLRLSKQITILRKKKIRLEAQIESMNYEKRLVESSFNKLQKYLERLNLHIFYQNDNKDKMQVEQKFRENDFRTELHDLETEYQSMISKLDKFVTEKDDLLLDLVDTEKIVQHWERKIQLLSEMKEVISCDYVQNELNSMKAEIHRMKVRQIQLTKMQEALVQDLEKSVSKREIIIHKSDALQANTSIDKNPTKEMIFKRMRFLRDDIKKMTISLNEAESNYEHELLKYNDLSDRTNSMQEKVDSLSQTVDSLKEKERDALVRKSVNIQNLYYLQYKLQHYRSLMEGKYVQIYKSSEKLDAEFVKQKSITQSLLLCIDQIIFSFEDSHYALKPLFMGLSNRVRLFNRLSVGEISDLDKDTSILSGVS